jgi:alpha-N-arabinofuranosidase
VNCLQSLFLAHEDKFCVTPTYHVFDLYAAHQGGQSVRTNVLSAEIRYTRNGNPASLRGLSASASVTGKQLTLTVANPSLDQAREAEIAVRSARPQTVTAWTLAAADPRAHNSFAEPRAVEPKQVTAALEGSGIRHRFPPASVTKITVALS